MTTFECLQQTQHSEVFQQPGFNYKNSLRIFDNQFIGYQRDQFAVGRLFSAAEDLYSVYIVYIFYFTARPSYFDGVPNGAFDLALIKSGSATIFLTASRKKR